MRCRCPNCHNALEIVNSETLKEIECPSCGSSFNLVADDSTATLAFEHRRIAHFELLTNLGSGQFGTVWKAKDTTLDRVVALKLPRATNLSEGDSEKFFREARAAAQVKHANIISIHEVGRDGENIYIASDFIEGANLAEWLSAKRMDPRSSAQLVATICDALHDAHEAGVVHRDLKPANIMMDLQDRPHIADFGLAKREAGEFTMTMDGQILGTPAYMSPEQAKGDGHLADRRSDIYSIGVIFYQLLTGELPFRGDTRMLIVQILNDEPTPLRKLSSKIPRELETICLKCLHKEPQRRYSTARELSEELGRYLKGEPILASPPGPIERGWKWIKKNQTPLTRVAAAVLAVVTLVFAAISLIAVRQSREANLQRAEAYQQRAIADEQRAAARMAEAMAIQARDEAVAAKNDAENARELALAARDAEAAAKEEAEKSRLQAVASEQEALKSKMETEKAAQVAMEEANRAREAEMESRQFQSRAMTLERERDLYAAVADIAYQWLLKEYGEDHAVVSSMRNRLLTIKSEQRSATDE